MLLWEEYCDANSDNFSYAWFCERYRKWAGRLKPTLRQVHIAGEKLFVDYSGHTMEVVGIGREHHVLGLRRGVDDDTVEVV
jgi:transposase